VTQAEEMPVEEALELREALASQLGRQPELLIVNGLFPPLPAGLERPEIFDPVEPLLPPALPPPAPELPLGTELLTFWRHRRFLNERELERLARWWEGPRIELPLLALERGPALTEALQQLLATGLAAAPAAPAAAGAEAVAGATAAAGATEVQQGAAAAKARPPGAGVATAEHA